MNTVTADSSLQHSLVNLDSLTEIRDSQDKIIGYFSPAAREAPAIYAQAAANFDAQEMKRRGYDDDTLDKVFYQNPVKFLSQSGKFKLEL